MKREVLPSAQAGRRGPPSESGSCGGFSFGSVWQKDERRKPSMETRNEITYGSGRWGPSGCAEAAAAWDTGRCTFKKLCRGLWEGVLLRDFWWGAWQNLKKSWFSRLVRSTKLSAIIVLALHINFEMTARQYVGSNFVLITYCLSATLLPEYSSSLYSALWVWLLTLGVTFLLTLLAFSALYAGGVVGPFAALAVILVLFAWVTVIRIPLPYRVPPFREAIDSSHLGKFALIFIPYNTCCTLLRMHHMMPSFASMGDGVRYLFLYVSWSMLFTLLGLALFAIQIATPPWTSQKAISREQMKNNMLQVAEALKALDSALELIIKAFTCFRVMCLRVAAGSAAADEASFLSLKADLEVAGAVLASAVSPLLEVLGSQSGLRARLVESGREPFWICPGPGINVMPEMARLQMVVLQASMHLVGAAKQLSGLVKAMERAAVSPSRALSTNVEEVSNSVKLAVLVCSEGAALLALGPSLRLFSNSKSQLAAEAQKVRRLRDRMESVVLRSPLGYGLLTRQPSVGAELAERAHGLLQKTGVFLRKTAGAAATPREAAAGDEEEADSGSASDAEGLDVESETQQETQQETQNLLLERQLQQLGGSQQQADLLVQKDKEEEIPPSASDKPATSRLRLLKLKAFKRQREAAVESPEERTTEERLCSGSPAYLTLPSLEMQSSYTPSAAVDRLSQSESSLFENASLFEGNATSSPFPGSPLPAEQTRGSPQAAANVGHASSRSRGGDARIVRGEQDNSENPPDAATNSRGSSINQTGQPMGILAKGNADSGQVANADAAQMGVAEGELKEAAAGRGFSPLTPTADEGWGRRKVGGGEEFSSFGDEEDNLVDHLSQGSCSGPLEKKAAQQSLTSCCCSADGETSGKCVRGIAARDGLAEVSFLPKYTEAGKANSAEESGFPEAKSKYAEVLRNSRHRFSKSELCNKALRYQVKLAMFVVSLIQIASKDSLDFCAALEALVYSYQTPSWKRFWLNIRMVFLSGTIMGMQLSRGLSDILCFWRWRFSGADAWFNDVDIVHCLKFVVGVTGLYAFGVFLNEEITMWLVGSVDLHSAVMPVSSWMMLGFVCTMKWTYEGTVHTAASRLLGTVLGCACIYGAMMTTNDYGVMLAWSFSLCFLSFFVFANSADVYGTFHPEFGYIGQVFLWTCVFIHQTVWLTMRSSPGSASALKLNVTNSRLWGNIVGVVTAVVLSHCPPSFSSETEVRSLCQSLMGDCSRCISLIGNAFVRSVLSSKDSPCQIDAQRQKQPEAFAEKRAEDGKREDVTTGSTGISFCKPTQPCCEPLDGELENTCNENDGSKLTEEEDDGFQGVAEAVTDDVNDDPCKRGREAKWKRGFFGIGFLAKPETFSRLPESPAAHSEGEHGSLGHSLLFKRDKIKKKLKKGAQALTYKHLAPHLRLRRHTSQPIVSSFEYLEKATEVLHRSFEPKLFLCRRLFQEGTKCPHSPLWWVDVSLSSVLDMMDYLRMSILDSCQFFMDCLRAVLSDFTSADSSEGGNLAHCRLLMQTAYGGVMRRRFVELIALQKAAYMDIGKEITAGQVGCWRRLPAYSICDCGRRQVSVLYLHSARGYMRRRILIESILEVIFSYLVKSSRELRKQTGHSAHERRMALCMMLLLLQKIEMRHAVTDDIHIYLVKSIFSRVFPERHFEELLQKFDGRMRRKRQNLRKKLERLTGR